jgi:hypothetical protein
MAPPIVDRMLIQTKQEIDFYRSNLNIAYISRHIFDKMLVNQGFYLDICI